MMLAEACEQLLTSISPQVVTYKWLARQYSLPSNYAKQ
jgi:hypothetical protein